MTLSEYQTLLEAARQRWAELSDAARACRSAELHGSVVDQDELDQIYAGLDEAMDDFLRLVEQSRSGVDSL